MTEYFTFLLFARACVCVALLAGRLDHFDDVFFLYNFFFFFPPLLETPADEEFFANVFTDFPQRSHTGDASGLHFTYEKIHFSFRLCERERN